ncbi:hypothetical protein SeLEV6574_g03017 [Synchytrium endobioticum]|uniref:Uncharacterized protein n=1 Tax=Synchytrium endobioticum TaxID=286115 RepID=A0A507D5C4_9FUNG|nr:hypothetical protein SeLEV6574_g03809 [Synchytrium endobioticum]TPX46477.1 hypothetical protein SeLEV6574_g03203 [Synchytrium endobioticum]TPX46793.1 hypothetical protein SeLEV6574_g03017 [Synchytrium endobioticum]
MQVVLVRVDLLTRECTRITEAALNSSWQLSTASKGLIVASASSTESPNKLRGVINATSYFFLSRSS